MCNVLCLIHKRIQKKKVRQKYLINLCIAFIKKIKHQGMPALNALSFVKHDWNLVAVQWFCAVRAF